MVFIGFLLGAYYNELVYLTPDKVSIGYKQENGFKDFTNGYGEFLSFNFLVQYEQPY